MAPEQGPPCGVAAGEAVHMDFFWAVVGLFSLGTAQAVPFGRTQKLSDIEL